MRVDNFKRLDDAKAPVFPQWGKRSATQKAGDIIGAIVGFLIWLGLVFIFLVTMYLYWFQKSLVAILKAVNPGHYHIPWWVSLLTLIFLAPLTLIVIVIGTIVMGFRK